MRRLFFLALLNGLVALTVNAADTASDRFLKSLPQGPVVVEQTAQKWSVKYCPDNTCDLLEISSSVREEEVMRLALGFFGYVSQYVYLRDWQQETRRNQSVAMELRLLSNDACRFQDERQIVRCVFEAI
jgi:hypothetical protein